MEKFCSIVRKLLKAKEDSGLSFEELGRAIGRDKVWVAALLYRQAVASKEEADKLKELLNLDEESYKAIQKIPLRGWETETVPSDPVIYRFYEIMRVYGPAIKAVINETFGDGIMSAIDFSIDIKKQEDPNGDRVVITFNGKFLPFKKW
ncbi:cyanate lyase [Thermodesulfatator indicus DSM 15286]|uniref:Cyanate hydratase n=1 Tax=Thermodesulfatator indicus (strain DSM 15286 / JCM 11887 / CIR29812) TaxID=667014 RepID=F8ADW1_THEID|nr:cyanase [Thermodesulfatator indicus]AEH44926.1 cyanate lyase [Thermodesulfatator indicus DSM 15286]